MDDDDTLDMLSDSDEEDEAEDLRDGGLLHTRSPPHADPATRRTDSNVDLLHKAEHSEDEDEKMIPDTTDGAERDAEGHASGEPVAAAASVQPVALRTRARSVGYPSLGPKRTRVVVRDAAWSTWWAVLYWVSLEPSYELDTNTPDVHRYNLLCTPALVIYNASHPHAPGEHREQHWRVGPEEPARVDRPVANGARHGERRRRRRPRPRCIGSH